MASLLFAPHADDETLFAAYSCLDRRPLIVVVFDQGREAEAQEAAEHLGCDLAQWPLQPGDERRSIEDFMAGIRPQRFDEIFAPAVLEEGHADHNAVGEAAQSVFGDMCEVISYLTYAPRGMRATSAREVVPSPEWIAAKLAALSCYRSQIQEASTRPWFYELLDMREWLA